MLKKLGEKEWTALSEQERQRRITQIKKQERRLRLQGKHDEVARLFQALTISENGDLFMIFVNLNILYVMELFALTLTKPGSAITHPPIFIKTWRIKLFVNFIV